MEYKSPIETLIQTYLNDPPDKEIDQTYNRRYLQSLNDRFRVIEKNPKNLKELVEIYIEMNKQLVQKDTDTPLQSKRKRELKTKLLIYSELALKSINITEDLLDDHYKLKGFKSLRSKLIAEKLMIYVFMLMVRKRHQCLLAGISALKIDAVMVNTGERVRDQFFLKINKLNKIFVSITKKKMLQPSLPLEKSFMRWKIRSNHELLRTCVEKIACNHRLKKETAIWRLKKLVLKDKSYRKTKQLDAVSELVETLDKAKKRIELNDKNFFLYSLMLITAKEQREEYSQTTQRFFDLMNTKFATKMNSVVDAIARQNPRKRLLHTIIKAAEKKNDYCFNKLRMLVKRQKLTTAYRFFDLVTTKLTKSTKSAIGSVLQHNPKQKLLLTFRNRFYSNLRRHFLLLKRKAQALKDHETMISEYTDLLDKVFKRAEKRDALQNMKNAASFKNNYNRLIDILGNNHCNNELRDARKALDKLKKHRDEANQKIKIDTTKILVQRQVRKTNKAFGNLLNYNHQYNNLTKRLSNMIQSRYQNKLADAYSFLKMNKNLSEMSTSGKNKVHMAASLASLFEQKQQSEIMRSFYDVKNYVNLRQNITKRIALALNRHSKYKQADAMSNMRAHNQAYNRRTTRCGNFIQQVGKVVNKYQDDLKAEFFSCYRQTHSRYREFYDQLLKTVGNLNKLNKRKIFQRIQVYGLEKEVKSEKDAYDNLVTRSVLSKLVSKYLAQEADVLERLNTHNKSYNTAVLDLLRVMTSKCRQKKQNILSALMFHKNTHLLMNSDQKKKLASVRLVHLLAKAENTSKQFFFSSIAKKIKDKNFALSVLNRSLNLTYKHQISSALKLLTNYYKNQQLKHVNLLLSHKLDIESDLKTRYHTKLLSHLFKELMPRFWKETHFQLVMSTLRNHAANQNKKMSLINDYLEPKTNLKLNSVMNSLQKHMAKDKLVKSNKEFIAFKLTNAVRKPFIRAQKEAFNQLKLTNDNFSKKLQIVSKLLSAGARGRCMLVIDRLRQLSNRLTRDEYLVQTTNFDKLFNYLLSKRLRAPYELKRSGDAIYDLLNKNLQKNVQKSMMSMIRVLQYNNLVTKHVLAKKNNMLSDLVHALNNKKYQALNTMLANIFRKETKMRERTQLIGLYKLMKRQVLLDLYKVAIKAKGQYIKKQYKTYAIKYILNALNKDLGVFFGRLKQNKVLRKQGSKIISVALYKVGKEAKKKSLRHLQAFCNLEKKHKQTIRAGFVHLITNIEHKREMIINSVMSRLVMNSNVFTKRKYVLSLLTSNLNYLKQLCFNEMVNNKTNGKEREEGFKTHSNWSRFIKSSLCNTGSSVKSSLLAQSEPFRIFQVLEKLANAHKIKQIEALKTIETHKNTLYDAINGKLKTVLRKLCINKRIMLSESFCLLRDKATAFRVNKKMINTSVKTLIASTNSKKALCFKYLKEPFWKRDRKLRAAGAMLDSFLKQINNAKLKGFSRLAPFSDSLRSKKANQLLRTLKYKSLRKIGLALIGLKLHANNPETPADYNRQLALMKLNSLSNKPIRELYRLSFIKLVSLLGRYSLRFVDRVRLLDLYIKHAESKQDNSISQNGLMILKTKKPKTELETVNMDILQNNKQLNTENFNLKQSKKYLVNQIKTHENLIQKIKADNMSIMKEKDDLVEREEDLIDYNKKLQEEIARLEACRGQLSEIASQKRYSTPQSTFNLSYSTRFETLARDNRTVRPEAADLYSELEKLNAEKLRLEDLINQCNKEREIVEDELDRIGNESDKLLREIKRLEQYKDHLTEELNQYKEQNAQLTEKNDELKSINFDLLEKIKQLNKDIEELELRIKELEEDLIAKEKTKLQIKEHNSELKAVNKSLKKENEKIQDNNENLNKEIGLINKQNASHSEHCMILSAENKLLEKELDELEVRNQHLEQQKVSSERVKTQLKDDNGFLSSQRQIQVKDQKFLNVNTNYDLIDKRRLSLQSDKLGSILSKLRIIDDNMETNNKRIEDEDKSIRHLEGSFLGNINEINMKKWKIENNRQLISRDKATIEENSRRAETLKDTIRSKNDTIAHTANQLRDNYAFIKINTDTLVALDADISVNKKMIVDLFEDLQEKKNLLNRLRIELDKNNYHIQSNVDLINRNLQRQQQIENEIKNNQIETQQKMERVEELNKDMSLKKFRISDLYDQSKRINDDISKNDTDYELTMIKFKNLQCEVTQTTVENPEVAYQSAQNRTMILKKAARNLQNMPRAFTIPSEGDKPAEDRLIELNDQLRRNALLLSDTRNIIVQKHIKIEENNMELVKAEHVMQKTSNKLNLYDDQISKNNALILSNNEQLSLNTRKIDEQKDILLRTYDEIMNINKVLQDVLENRSRSQILGGESPIKPLDRSRWDVSGFDLIATQLKPDANLKELMPRNSQTDLYQAGPKKLVVRLLGKALHDVIYKQKHKSFNTIKIRHFIRKQLNRPLTTTSVVPYQYLQNEKARAEERYKNLFSGPLNALSDLVTRKINDHYHHFKLIIHLKICKMYLNSLFRWKAQNMEYNHKKALVRAKARRHHLPLLLMQKVYKTKAEAFKDICVGYQKLKLQKYYSKLLPVIINGENHYKSNVKTVLKYWYEIKDESKWFIRILRNVITQTAIQPQIALWRMKMYRPPKLFVNPKVKLGLTQLLKVVGNNEELNLIRAFWDMEKAQMKLDTSLEFDDEFTTEKRKTIQEIKEENLSLEFSGVKTENEEDIELSEIEEVQSLGKDADKLNFNDYMRKIFLKTLVSQTKRTKAYYFHRLLYFMLKEKKNDLNIDVTRWYNTRSQGEMQVGAPSLDEQAVSESIKLLVDENLVCKELIEAKELTIKNLNDQLVSRKADIQFLKNHYLYSFLNRIEFFIKRNGKNEVYKVFKSIENAAKQV